MKHLILAAGSHEGLRLLAPLYESLAKHEAFQPSALVAGPIPPDIAQCFHIADVDSCPLSAEGTHGQRLSAAIACMEQVMLSRKPDMVVLCGSDTATLGAALAASGLGLSIAVADAGLRDYQRSEQAEMHRKLIDATADVHFVSEHSGEYNLINEGYPEESLFFVGNLAIDSLVAFMERSDRGGVTRERGLEPKCFALVHPGALVREGSPSSAASFLRLIEGLAALTNVVLLEGDAFVEQLHLHGLEEQFHAIAGVQLAGNQGDGEMLVLLRDSALLLAPDGVLQAEATVMDVPHLSLASCTERPSTIETGTAILSGGDESAMLERFADILSPGEKPARRRSLIPQQWDGAAASRMVAVFEQLL